MTTVHVPKMRAGRIEVFEEGREEKGVDFKGENWGMDLNIRRGRK